MARSSKAVSLPTVGESLSPLQLCVLLEFSYKPLGSQSGLEGAYSIAYEDAVERLENSQLIVRVDLPNDKCGFEITETGKIQVEESLKVRVPYQRE